MLMAQQAQSTQSRNAPARSGVWLGLRRATAVLLDPNHHLRMKMIESPPLLTNHDSGSRNRRGLSPQRACQCGTQPSQQRFHQASTHRPPVNNNMNKPNTDLIAAYINTLKIPQHWSAEQAMAVWEFINEVVRCLWDRYERPLVELIKTELKQNHKQLDLFYSDRHIPDLDNDLPDS
jgi:hypothetical protein